MSCLWRTEGHCCSKLIRSGLRVLAVVLSRSTFSSPLLSLSPLSLICQFDKLYFSTSCVLKVNVLCMCVLCHVGLMGLLEKWGTQCTIVNLPGHDSHISFHRRKHTKMHIYKVNIESTAPSTHSINSLWIQMQPQHWLQLQKREQKNNFKPTTQRQTRKYQQCTDLPSQSLQ